MTLWLDKRTVEEYFVESLNATGELVENYEENGRRHMTIEYDDSITLSDIELSELHNYLQALRDVNPELTINSNNGAVRITIHGDEDGYRE